MRLLTLGIVVGIVFVLYTHGLSANPPGSYLDESAIAYNAHLVARTGAGEFGPRFPLYFVAFTRAYAQYINPVQVYLLATVFLVFPPSILTARMFGALCMFVACLLLGWLARRICTCESQVNVANGELLRIDDCTFVGVIVAVSALITPWLFELGRLVFEVSLLPFVLVLILLSVHRASRKDTWNWWTVVTLAGSLALLTYCYSSGRLLGVFYSVGLLFFATSRQRLISILKTWVLYGLTLTPILVFNHRHPEAPMKRFYEVSYIRPGVPWNEVAFRFVGRYFEDQSFIPLLFTGDFNVRHHVQGSGGAIFLATLLLALGGLIFAFTRQHQKRFWWFVVYGAACSIVPGAITNDRFHALRLAAYPVFLLLLMVPSLEWLLSREQKAKLRSAISAAKSEVSFSMPKLSRVTRLGILTLLLAITLGQAIRFFMVYSREGPKRQVDFDAPYKAVYDAAVIQPTRPIYLEDGKAGPAYIHAFWYATIEARPTTEFVHLDQGVKPPAGVVVITAEESCQNCEVIIRNGAYLLYKSK